MEMTIMTNPNNDQNQNSDLVAPIDMDNLESLYNKTKILINGKFDYICLNIEILYKQLIRAKRLGVINIYSSISFNPDLNELNIYTDAGRCCRPLYVIEDGSFRITKKDVENFDHDQVPSHSIPSDASDVDTLTEPEIEDLALVESLVSTTEPEVPASSLTKTEAKEPLTRMRQQIARVTVKSKTEKPHFYVSAEIDMTRAMSLRRQVNEQLSEEGLRITVNDLVVKACVASLKKYPKFNAYYEDDGIQYNDIINIAVAIAEQEGLIVPAIIDCGDKSLRQLSQMIKDLAERSASGTLSPQEYTGGTFAISNLGMFDVTSFVAIIHPPQSAVLAVGTVSEKPVARDGEISIAQIMTATLSADHRIVDGAESAQFLIEVKSLFENPMGLVL